MKKLFKLSILVFWILMLAFPLRADIDLFDDLDFEIDDTDAVEELVLYRDQPKSISATMPTRVVIGRPEIMDVISVSDREIVVTGKKAGGTTFVYWDSFGEHNYQVKVFKRDMSYIKGRIDSILSELDLPGVHTKAVDSESRVMLLGEVNLSSDRERMHTALEPLKKAIIDLVKVKENDTTVEIEVQVLELNRDGTNTLGFTWPGSTSTLTEATHLRKTLGHIPDSLMRISEWTHPALTAQVDFLVQEGKARVLSRPRISCQSGKEAKLMVGGEKPIMTTSTAATGGSSTEVEYKEYGIIFNVKPTVVGDDRIKLGLNIEVSEVGDAEYLGDSDSPTAKAYPLKKRSATTELFLNDSQTLSIGGIMKQKTSDDVRRVPGISKVPLIGKLFTKRSTTKGGGSGERGEVELFITLTPKIIHSTAKPKAVAPQKVSKNEGESSLSKFGRLKFKKELPLELEEYIQAVQSKVINVVRYPQEAKDAGWQGTLRLVLLVTSDGNLKEMSIAQSTGYKILDDAGQEAVRKTVPFPPLPKQPGSLGKLSIEIPIVYRAD